MKTELNTLVVDLSSGTCVKQTRNAADASLEEKLGGIGDGVRAFENHIKRNPGLYDAFDPQNLLSISIGFATGSNLMTSRRTYISGLSPLKSSQKGTNGYMYSASSGDLGPELRKSGIDSIRITGRSDKPIYLLIDNDRIGFQDASQLAGKTTHDRIMALAEKHEGAAYAVVGPAAAKKVRYAGVAFSTFDQVKKGSRHMRFAGRGGFGAILADKNLLGIVVKGDGANRLSLGDLKELNREIGTGKKTRKYADLGTYGANLELMDRLKAGIHENFSHDQDRRSEPLFRSNLLAANYRIANKGCVGCGIKCWKEIQSPQGKVLGKVDYEPGSLLGPNLGIYNLERTLELINLADELGMDSMSLGVCIGYEMDRQKMFIEDASELSSDEVAALENRNFEFAKELIMNIASGEHPLKEGLFRYAGNAPNAMHAKGIEFAAYLGHLNPGYAFAVSGGHMSMDTYNAWCYQDATGAATNSIDEWIENIIRGPQMILYDMNGICKFAKVDFDHVAQLYQGLYGEEVNADDMRDVAKLVNLRIRMIDESRGFGAQDEVMPADCYQDLGFVIPQFLTPEFFDKLKDGVYQRHRDMKKNYQAKGVEFAI